MTTDYVPRIIQVVAPGPYPTPSQPMSSQPTALPTTTPATIITAESVNYEIRRLKNERARKSCREFLN